MPHNHADHTGDSHSHGEGFKLDPQAHAVLVRGLAELIRMTEGLEYKPLPSESYPFPLTQMTYETLPDPKTVRADIEKLMESDPVSVLEEALALLELYECNQPDIEEHVLQDMSFVNQCFSSKRCNGWACVMGDADRAQIEETANAKWQFKFINGPDRSTGCYSLLNRLARYAYVYGRIEYGDSHGLGHFVEDHCPGVLICHGNMSDIELMLSLAAMKMGVPAVVPSDYPFPLGRSLRVDTLDDIAEAVVGFQNIRQLLRTPEIAQMPDYCSPENMGEKFEPNATWAATPDSFFIVRKGEVASPGCSVLGRPGPAMGVIVTIDAEPMDAFDRRYIEKKVAMKPSMMRGVAATYEDGALVLALSDQANLDPERIGKVLIAAVRHDFPKLDSIHVEILFDPARLAELAPAIRAEKDQREAEIASATEENVDHFYACVGCSPFAPDHVCALTPERRPQCGRPYEMIKTGALYGYDDMSNIHHSKLHRDINSFQVMEKGRCIDPVTGEWEGVNKRVAELTHGRTTRVQLHSVESYPHTGCGCFQLIIFKTDVPKPGIGIMDRGYHGTAPDGRSWKDLHYALAGKQAPGMAGCMYSYLHSPKLIRAHGGMKSVVWMSPKVKEFLGEHSDIPEEFDE